MSGRLKTAAGVALAIVGLAALAAPGLTASLPATDVVVLLLGALLALGGVREIQRRRHTEFAVARTDDPERSVDLATPGDGTDDRLYRIARGQHNWTRREQLREEVEAVAVDALRRRRGYSRAEATRRLREGTWTDDPFAAAFFTREAPDVDPLTRVRAVLSPTPGFEQQATRAIEAVHAVLEGEDG